MRSVFADPLQELRLSLMALALLLALGTAGYAWLEGMTLIEALYMTVITLSTVGFGEVRPLSPAGRLFTIALIMLGVGTVAWALRNAAEVVLGETFWKGVRKQRMEEQLRALRDHYLVLGYGRIGRQVVRDLRARGQPYVVVDASPEVAEELLEEGHLHVVGDATQEEVLQQAGVERARGLVAALETDADNVLAVLTARALNPNLLIVARATDEEAESKLRRAGADRVVTPYLIGGHRLALSLLNPVVDHFLSHLFHLGDEIDVDIGQIAVPPGSSLAGQRLADCDLRRVWNLTVVGVQRPDGSIEITPQADHVIEPGEVLIVIGPRQAIYQFERQDGGRRPS